MFFAFRGTQRNGRDILNDLRGLPKRDADLGWVHRGFRAGANAVWSEVWKAARDAHAFNLRLYFCGHSKGAAEATLAAAMITVAGLPVAGPVTLGSPLVGFARLGRVLAGVPVRRYVRGRDAITSHPWPLWGYRHVGLAIRIGTPAPRFGTPPGRWADHRVAGYVADFADLDRAGDPRAAWA